MEISKKKFSTTAVWNAIRPKQEIKDWHKVLWASFSNLKHVLISWMAILNRLPTIDHLEAWGMDVTRLCRLCQNEKESKDHLYFCCKFSKVI